MITTTSKFDKKLCIPPKNTKDGTAHFVYHKTHGYEVWRWTLVERRQSDDQDYPIFAWSRDQTIIRLLPQNLDGWHYIAPLTLDGMASILRREGYTVQTPKCETCNGSGKTVEMGAYNFYEVTCAICDGSGDKDMSA